MERRRSTSYSTLEGALRLCGMWQRRKCRQFYSTVCGVVVIVQDAHSFIDRLAAETFDFALIIFVLSAIPPHLLEKTMATVAKVSERQMISVNGRALLAVVSGPYWGLPEEEETIRCATFRQEPHSYY